MTNRAPPSNCLLTHYAKNHPDEFALIVAHGDGAAVSALLTSLPGPLLPTIVVRLPLRIAKDFLKRASDGELVRWLSETDLDSAIRLARQIGQSRRADLGDRLPASRRRDIDRYTSFPDTGVGAYVDTNFATVNESQSIAEVVRALGPSKSADRLVCLVVDGKGHLIGSLDAHLALLAGSVGLVKDCVARTRPLLVGAHVHAAAVEFAANDEPWLPVVDGRFRPVGLLHRSRLPDFAKGANVDASSMFATLATALFELLAELPVLAGAARRNP